MTDGAELARISAAIHDRWFDLDGVVHDVKQSEVRLTVYPGRQRGRLPTVERPPNADALPPAIGELIVRNVVRVTVVDGAEIGWFDVAQLEFDAAAGRVRLSSSVPLDVLIEVRALDVELVRPGPQSG
jgi:hypothetical protein